MTIPSDDRSNVPGLESVAGNGFAGGEVRLYVQGQVRKAGRVAFTLLVDGTPMPCVFGANRLSMAAGKHRFELTGLLRGRPFGRVSLDVDVLPGVVTDLFYAPPAHKWAAGNAGLVPQQHAGLGLYFTVWALWALIIGLSVGYSLAIMVSLGL